MDSPTETFSGEEVSCREFLDFLSDYLAGELPPRENAIFAAHLRICVDCVNYLESFRETLRLEREAEPPQAAPPMPEELIRAILAARGADKSV